MLSKLLTYIFAILIVITGFSALPTVIDWVNAKNVELGSSEHLKYAPSIDVYKNGYTITYNLDGGIVEGNPTNYSLFSETFTLNNPTKAGCLFEGWTGTDIEEPQLNVTILAGSSGNLEFTAHYTKSIILEKPVVTYAFGNPQISWTTTEDTELFDLKINDFIYTTENTFYDLYDFKDHFVLGSNCITITPISHIDKTLFKGPASDPIIIVQKQLDVTNVTLDDDLLSWVSVDNTRGYKVVVWDDKSYVEVLSVDITTNSFDLYTYGDLFQVGKEYIVRIYAIGDDLFTLTSEPAVINYTFSNYVEGYSGGSIGTYLENYSGWFEDCFVDSSYGTREGRLYLQLESVDNHIYCFKMSDFGLENLNIVGDYECDSKDITIYELNKETSALELLYDEPSLQLQFLRDTKFKIDDKYYFKFINEEPGLFETELDYFIYRFSYLFSAVYNLRLSSLDGLGYTSVDSYCYSDEMFAYFSGYFGYMVAFYSSSNDKQVYFRSNALTRLDIYSYGINELG